jgi:hypothetical protein
MKNMLFLIESLTLQAKEWRMSWLKRRRERLATKLHETQREIELMKAN